VYGSENAINGTMEGREEAVERAYGVGGTEQQPAMLLCFWRRKDMMKRVDEASMSQIIK